MIRPGVGPATPHSPVGARQSLFSTTPFSLRSRVCPLNGLGRREAESVSPVLNKMERVKGQVNEGDTILVDHSDGRTFFVKVESGK